MMSPDREKKPDLRPPGNCTQQEHRVLQSRVNNRCKKPKFKCKKGMDCKELKKRRKRAMRCYMARKKINDKCFNGGDDAHKKQAKAARRAWLNCKKVFKFNC